MKKCLSTHEAKTQFSKLIENVLAGDEVIVCRGKSPVVRIVKYKVKGGSVGRPKVGVITSAPVKYDADTFAALAEDADLAAWGMK